MKYFMTFFAVLMLAACGASSSASKAETKDVDLLAQMPVLTGDFVWKMNKAESDLSFVATHNSREFTGEFSRFETAIALDPENPESGEIHALIDLSSVDAGDRDRNANLPGKDWFDIASFPLATFTSNDISTLGAENYKANGELSLKGISRPVSLLFSLQIDGNKATAVGGTALNRTDFNVGEGPDFEGEDWVKFPVSVKFNIIAER